MVHKVGIIGYGGMAGYHHDNYIRTGCMEAVAVYDIDQERLFKAVEKGLKAFDSLEGFLSSHLFDIILVATPNNFHHDMAVAALEAGYNVVCEKPVAMNVCELENMIAVANKCGKLFTVHHNRRWDTDYNVVRKSLEDGLLGKPYTIESCVHGSGGVMHGWRAYKIAGGGMLLDWGIHLIDQILDMIKEPIIDISCFMASVKTPEVDDYFKLLLTFESGLNVQIEVGTYCLKSKPRWYVNGTEGSLILEGWDCDGVIVHAAQDGIEWEPEVVQTKAGPTRTMAPRPKETLSELPLPKIESDWADFYRNIAQVLEGKAEIIIKHDELLRVFKVVEAAFKSAETHHSIAVNL